MLPRFVKIGDNKFVTELSTIFVSLACSPEIRCCILLARCAGLPAVNASSRTAC